MPSLNKALMIAIIFNALLIAIGGLMYYRRKMNQQTINTLELMKYGNGKDKGKDKKHEIDFNNAAA
jgi:LPXTG-motif cell wall-anchored protein